MPSIGLEERSHDGWVRLQREAAAPSGEAPETAEDFARCVIRAICHASVTATAGRRSYERCMRALDLGATARSGFRHPGKAEAVDTIWRERQRLFAEYSAAPDKLRHLATLPWIGPVTAHALARRLGLFADRSRRAAA